VEEMNRCSITQLESGVALLVEVTTDEANIAIENIEYSNISPSLWQMLEIYHKSNELKHPIVEIEI